MHFVDGSFPISQIDNESALDGLAPNRLQAIIWTYVLSQFIGVCKLEVVS